MTHVVFFGLLVVMFSLATWAVIAKNPHIVGIRSRYYPLILLGSFVVGSITACGVMLAIRGFTFKGDEISSYLFYLLWGLLTIPPVVTVMTYKDLGDVICSDDSVIPLIIAIAMAAGIAWLQTITLYTWML